MNGSAAPTASAHGPVRSERAREAGRRWEALLSLDLLLVESSTEHRDATAAELSAAGLRVHAAGSGAEALIHLGSAAPDAVLIGATGQDVETEVWVRAARSVSSVPILVGVDKGDADLAGPTLVAGATAFVARPYQVPEVMTRLRSMGSLLGQERTRVRLAAGVLELNVAAFECRFRGRRLALALKEFELLRCLMLNAGRVVGVEEIRAALWGVGTETPSSNAVKIYVSRLRSELGEPAVVQTVRGRGYVLRIT